MSSRRDAGLHGQAMGRDLPNPSCTWSCTPAICRGARALLRGALRLARRSGSTPRRGSYLALELGGGLGGGIVECATERPLWLPYVEVDEIAAATERARALGAAVLLEPREGPAGWRSVVATPAGGEIAFWQQKR